MAFVARDSPVDFKQRASVRQSTVDCVDSLMAEAQTVLLAMKMALF